MKLFLTGPYGMRTDPSQSSVVILSCSLNPSSRSHKLALAARAFLRAREVSVELVDLAEHDLPVSDGTGSFDHPSVKALTGIIDVAGAILVSSPVYNYDLSAAAKNLMELTGSAWTEKPVGFLCAAGGRAGELHVADRVRQQPDVLFPVPDRAPFRLLHEERLYRGRRARPRDSRPCGAVGRRRRRFVLRACLGT